MILVICNDVVGPKMAGPAIRCVEICKVLSKSFPLIMAAPKIDGNIELPFETCLSSSKKFDKICLGADLVVIQGDALNNFPVLRKISGVLIVDLYCPIPLEYHQVSDGVPLDVRTSTIAFLTDSLLEQLVYGDHFLCASEKQRDFWLGALTVAGRVNALRWPKASHANVSDLISMLPFGLDSTSPVLERKGIRELFDIPDNELVMVWGGGVYQWFDPLTIIRALHRLVEEGFRVHLVFIGVKHPNPGISQHDMCANAVELSKKLELIDKFVHFNFGWVDYVDRHNYLLDADIGVSAHFDNPETRFAFRTRMLDYLWCGLPIIATRGDVFGDSLRDIGAGISVDFEDVDGWVEALKTLIADRELLERFRQGSLRHAREFHWDRIVEPFATRCKALSTSSDREFIRNGYNRRIEKPSVMARARHVYSTGGVKSIISIVLRRIGRFVH